MALPASPRMRGRFNDCSGTIISGGASQVLLPQNPNRNYFFIQNHHATADLWVNFGITAVAAQPSVRIPAGADLAFEGSYCPTEDVTVIGPTTGQSFTAKEG